MTGHRGQSTTSITNGVVDGLSIAAIRRRKASVAEVSRMSRSSDSRGGLESVTSTPVGMIGGARRNCSRRMSA